jgi:N-acylglucosamine 2-epimerase
MKGIGVPMIMINTAQQIRETIGDPRCDFVISNFIAQIERDFVKDDIRCVMEQVGLKVQLLIILTGAHSTPDMPSKELGLSCMKRNIGRTIRI